MCKCEIKVGQSWFWLYNKINSHHLYIVLSDVVNDCCDVLLIDLVNAEENLVRESILPELIRLKPKFWTCLFCHDR